MNILELEELGVVARRAAALFERGTSSGVEAKVLAELDIGSTKELRKFDWWQSPKCALERLRSAGLNAEILPDTTVSTETIQTGAVEFASKLTRLIPQDNSGTLGYHISGSLSTNLLSKAQSYTRLDLDLLPAIVKAETVVLSPEQRAALTGATRVMGDIDLQEVEPGSLAHLYEHSVSGPNYHELSDSMLRAFRGAKYGENLEFHHLPPMLMKPVSITVNSLEFYIHDPYDAVQTKLRVLESVPETFKAKHQLDYEKLREAFKSSGLYVPWRRARSGKPLL